MPVDSDLALLFGLPGITGSDGGGGGGGGNSAPVPVLTNPRDRWVALNQTIATIAIANSGGAGTYSVTSGTLPTGLSLNTSTGDITGTVDAGVTPGVFTLELTCTNGAGSDAVTFNIDVRATFVEIDSSDTFPYYASTANALYLLTENVSTPGSAIKLHATGVVLDLNGYEITYNNATPIVIPNASFETGTGAAADNWDFTNAPNAERWAGSWIDSEVYDGDYSIKFNDTTLNEYVESTGTIVLLANTTYALTAMVEYGGEGVDANPGVVMYVSLVSGGTPVHTASKNTGNARGIQLIEATVTTGGSNETYSVRVGITGHASATVPVFIDDIKVQMTKVYGVATSAKNYNAAETPDLTTYGTANDTVITNGSITQGQDNGTWCHGIFHYGTDGTTMENLTITVQGANTSCIYGRDEYTYTSVLNNCALVSNATTISDRDLFYGAVVRYIQGTITNNTITGGPHAGFLVKGGEPGIAWVASTVSGNTIRLRGHYTNGFGILASRGSQIFNNQILCGSGEWHSRGIRTVGAGDVTTSIYNNTIEVQDTLSNQEYGGSALGGVYGIQLEDAVDVEVYGNTVTAYGNDVEGFAFRANGTCLTLNVHDNTFTATAGTAYAACCKFSLVNDNEMVFEDNALITNNGIVGATAESDLTLTRCTITAAPTGTTRPFECDWAAGSDPHVELRFLDTVFADATTETYFRDAQMKHPAAYGGGVNTRGAFSLTWSTTVHVEAFGGGDSVGCGLVVTDAQDVEVFNDVTDANGEAAMELAEFRTVGATKTTSTPHEANADDLTYVDTVAITADQAQTVNMQLDTPPPPPTFPDDWAGYDSPSALLAPSATLTDFTYLISLNQLSATWWSTVAADGDDIRVTKSDGTTEIPFDLIEFDQGTTSGLLAVKYAGNQTATPDDILIWCGQAGAASYAAGDTYGRNNTYRTACRAFYPSGGGTDRTANANDLTMTGATPGGVTGPINGSKATDYNGTNQYGIKTTPTNGPTAAPLTIAACINPDTVSGFHVAANVASTVALTNGFNLRQNGADMRFDVRATSNGIATAAASLSISTWFVCHGRENSTTSREIDIDGANGINTTSLTPASITRFHVGIATPSESNYFDGKIAMVAIWDAALSDAEVAYREAMLDGADPDQSAFFGTWAWTANP